MKISMVIEETYDLEKESFVFLMNKKGTQHAFIIIENGDRLYKADLLAGAEMDDYPDDSSFHSMKRSSGLAACSSATPSITTQMPTGGESSSSSACNNSTDLIFSALDVLESCVRYIPLDVNRFVKEAEANRFSIKSWKITHEQRETLENNIRTSKKNPPPFHIAGGRRFFDTNKNMRNCITWAEEMLSSIGLPQSKVWIDYITAAKPSKHVERRWFLF